jgi:hypothetical protein
MYETHQPREESDSPRELEEAGVGIDQGLDTLQVEEKCPEAMEYVNQLIARMKGVGSTIAPSAETRSSQPKREPRATSQKTREPERKVDTTTPSIPKQPPKVTVKPPHPEPVTRSEFNRSARVPEKSTDLRRLREAANLSATSILHAYELQATTRRAYTDLTMAIASMATSMVLVSLSHQMVSITYGCAILTFAQAAWSTWSYLRRTDLLGKPPTPVESLLPQET